MKAVQPSADSSSVVPGAGATVGVVGSPGERPVDAVGREPARGPGGPWVVLALLGPGFLAVAWLVSGARWVWSHRPDMQFGWVVVVLSAYVFWEKWPARPPLRPRVGVATLLLAGTGLALLWVVQAYHAAFGTGGASLCAQGLGTVLVACAALHHAFGWAGVSTFGFPFAFLLVAMPLPSSIQGAITHHLQNLIALLNVELLNLFGIPAQRVGSLIHLPNGTVGVNEACSGIRSLQSSVMATLFIGYLTLRSQLLRVLLFVGGIFVAVGGNFVRSFYLSYTASMKGVASADEVHDAAGWSILLFTAICVAALAWWFARIEKRALAPPPGSSGP